MGELTLANKIYLCKVIHCGQGYLNQWPVVFSLAQISMAHVTKRNNFDNFFAPPKKFFVALRSLNGRSKAKLLHLMITQLEHCRVFLQS
jgi:uncharacterized membrane protein YfbV (UPF0208 family)